MKKEQIEKIEKKAEERCKLINPIHRDCYVTGFLAGARMFFSKYMKYKDLYNKMKIKNLEMLERMDRMNNALDKIEL